MSPCDMPVLLGRPLTKHLWHNAILPLIVTHFDCVCCFFFSKGMLIEGPPGPSGPAVSLLSKNKYVFLLYLSKSPVDLKEQKLT